MSSTIWRLAASAAAGLVGAAALSVLGPLTVRPVAAKNTVAYHGVVTPACERMPGQTGGEEWTSAADGTRCLIEFREDISGSAVFVFGMGAVTSPASVSVGGRRIAFQALGPAGRGNGFSFLVIR